MTHAEWLLNTWRGHSGNSLEALGDAWARAPDPATRVPPCAPAVDHASWPLHEMHTDTSKKDYEFELKHAMPSSKTGGPCQQLVPCRCLPTTPVSPRPCPRPHPRAPPPSTHLEKANHANRALHCTEGGVYALFRRTRLPFLALGARCSHRTAPPYHLCAPPKQPSHPLPPPTHRARHLLHGALDDSGCVEVACDRHAFQRCSHALLP